MNKIFTLSLDDGHPHDKIAAEIMLKYGVRGTFYPNLYRINKCHKDIHVKLEIGSHGLTHEDPRKMDQKTLEKFVSRKPFEDFLGKPIKMFASPWGFYDNKVIVAIKEEGYIGARNIKKDLTYSHPKNPFCMEITFVAGRIPTFKEFKPEFDKFLKEKEGLFHIAAHCSGVHLSDIFGPNTFEQFEEICKYVRKSKIDSLTNCEAIENMP